MDLIRPKTLEDIIINLLRQGQKKTTAVLSDIREIRGNTTKQGFYVALRKLKAEEIIVSHKSLVALNTAWINKMSEELENISRAYTSSGAFDIFSLENKENLQFYFLNSKSLDRFWGHAQNILLKSTPSNEPIYAYDPHYWFYLARQATEQGLLKEIIKNGRQFLMTVGGDSPLDKIIKPEFDNDFLQYHIGNAFEKQNYYVTAIGDYVTEVFLDPRLAKKVDELYKQYDRADEALLKELQALLEAKSKNRIKISKNHAKAEKIKKKLGKNFYIKNK